MITQNKLKYYGLLCPYANRYPLPLGYDKQPAYSFGAPAVAVFEILTATLANFDGQTIQSSFVSKPSSSTSFTLTFDDDTAPPSTSTAVNISGLTTTTEIAEQLALSLSLLGFRVEQAGARVFVEQPVGGASGNFAIVTSGGLTDDLAINGVDPNTNETFFYNGSQADVPLLWGPKRGIGMSGSHVQFIFTGEG